jgi:CRISPR system Cascade subunit CasD
MGLMAAALGTDRADQEGHDALEVGYGLAVRLDRSGTAMVDYHTAQTARQSVVKENDVHGQPRAALLAAGEPETMLSWRTYRQDALATVALWARPGARWTLEQLGDALRHPGFVLYAGRKANPLGLPLNPEIIRADTLLGALIQRPHAAACLEWPACERAGGTVAEIAHDPCEGFESGLRTQRRETRRDGGAHRGRWQFSERVVEIGVAPSEVEP